ncbi:MAG: response regulator [Nitrososphaeraceae archaeon]|nr:response regulator [Nitrososphaeraceae archaeon]
MTLKLALEGEGFEVDTFDNPKLALSSFRPNYYDLLLLDIKMPGMNGFEFYREIKKIDDTIKVCFLTAAEFTLHEDFLKENEINAKCFAHKPILLDELAKLIKEQLK